VTQSEPVQAPGAQAGWEGLFWLVFARSANPIVLLDDQRRVVEANDAALKLFGREREEVIGMSIVESITPADRPAAAREWQEFLRTGEYGGRRILIRGDRSRVDVDFAARLEVIGGRRLAIYVATLDERSQRWPSSRRSAELPLTSREREVITLIALGLETPQIAQELHISAQTVRTHVRNAMSKLGARTRAQLVARVICNERAIHVPCLME